MRGSRLWLRRRRGRGLEGVVERREVGCIVVFVWMSMG